MSKPKAAAFWWSRGLHVPVPPAGLGRIHVCMSARGRTATPTPAKRCGKAWST